MSLRQIRIIFFSIYLIQKVNHYLDVSIAPGIASVTKDSSNSEVANNFFNK